MEISDAGSRIKSGMTNENRDGIVEIMPKKKQQPKDTPEWQRYAGAQIEEIKGMFEVIIEHTKDIPKMKEDISGLKQDVNTLKTDVSGLKQDVKHILTWEDDVKLIPVIFEEVGKVREDLEVLKHEMQQQNKADKKQMQDLERRVSRLEQKIEGLRVKQR